jgi:hypothetical protein
MCSLCGKKIGFLRAFTDEKYCCAAHREEEEQTIRKLAIERLRQPVVLDGNRANA